MRASAKYLTGLLAFGLSMGGAAASAVEQPGATGMPVSMMLYVQEESARQKVMDYLVIAEQAMQKNDWSGAELAISKAEQFEQQVPANEPPLTYRPADAWRKLNVLKSDPTRTAPAQLPANPQANQLQLPPLSDASSMQAKKDEAVRLLAQAQAALARNDVVAAQQLTDQARALRVPDDMFLPGEKLPWQMALDVRSAMNRRNVVQANFNQQSGQGQVQQTLYNPQADGSQVRPVNNEQDINPYLNGLNSTVDSQGNQAMRLIEMGREALRNQDTIAARDYFAQALRFQNQLDNPTRAYLREQLTSLGGNDATPAPRAYQENLPVQGGQNIEQIDAQQQQLLDRMRQEIFREQNVAERMVLNRDPRGALLRLQQLRDRVSQAGLDQASKQHYLTIVDREILEMEQYIERNIVQIENDETNAARLEDVQRRRDNYTAMEKQLQQLIDDFNMLMEEGRVAEAEVIARQAYELAPGLPEVEVVLWKARFARRFSENNRLRDFKEGQVWETLQDIEESAVPFPDNDPYVFGDAKVWEDLSERRLRQMRDGATRSAEDIRIMQALRTTRVDVSFDRQPLADVLATLSQAANINIDMNTRAMADEGVQSDTPISIDLQQPVTLESALHLVLRKVGLTFQVRDEVIQVTTEEMKSRNVYRETYYVGDLVIPIPNFVPSYNMGLPAALSNAYRTASTYGNSGFLPATFAGVDPAAGNGGISPAVLAQNLPDSPFNLGGMNGFGGPPAAGFNPGSMGFGPGGMGGGIVADYDALMELIENTIAPESWEAVGGPGTMSPFQANLSLVVSQTQDVHEQIQDLLDQLRRLQDLQITIEVRFITLQDDFFERIGVDFDFDIRHGQTVPQDGNGQFLLPSAGPPSLTVGRQPVSNVFAPTADLDLKFIQDSFASAVPQFGGFDPNTAANFGFAILSDIEVFFLLQASKGDTRTNILQAPKVTLFNGQTATVQDTAQRPFVTSIIPVVGDFAAAQQPVILVLNEGTQLSVQAVTSRDRRFVRLTLVPFFSQIGDVEEFTFTGTETTTTGTNIVDPTNPNQTIQDGATVTRSGSTVQLPVFGFTSVSTTVSVPDGGTVLLGGIKRLQEGRNERGVPVLSNVPYVSRLFKNVGIGRTSQSLMMMVTPRIIIQEEEERNQVGSPGS